MTGRLALLVLDIIDHARVYNDYTATTVLSIEPCLFSIFFYGDLMQNHLHGRHSIPPQSDSRRYDSSILSTPYCSRAKPALPKILAPNDRQSPTRVDHRQSSLVVAVETTHSLSDAIRGPAHPPNNTPCCDISSTVARAEATCQNTLFANNPRVRAFDYFVPTL